MTELQSRLAIVMVNINCMNCIGFLISYVHMLKVLNKLETIEHRISTFSY